MFDRWGLGGFGGTAGQAETAGGVSGQGPALDAGRDRIAVSQEVGGRRRVRREMEMEMGGEKDDEKKRRIVLARQ